MKPMRPLVLDEIPAVTSGIGTWVRIDRVARHEERVTFRVTYENQVGGTVAHRFRTLRKAQEFTSLILRLYPRAAQLQGRTVTH